MRNALLMLVVLALAACTGVGGGSSGSGPVDGLVGAVDVSRAEYLVVEIATGRAEGRREIADLRTNPVYRDAKMVFRRVPAAIARLGSGGTRAWGQGDEPDRTVTVRETYLAVFETTRAQWRRLGGGDPAAAIAPAALAGGTDEQLPVAGVSLNAARALMAAGPLRGRLALPGDDEWERAARADGGTFAWGEDRDEATVGRFARVRQTAAGSGPERPGAREPNALGLFDMAGNLWEWTDAGELRGGSWSDGLAMARPANRVQIDEDTAHALAGVRFAYVP
jgi:formylglycine-generating enzyme required for sulfatase activity